MDRLAAWLAGVKPRDQFVITVMILVVILLALAACGSSAGVQITGPSQPAATSQPPPAPSPVSTTATLSGTCTMGWVWVATRRTRPRGVFYPGHPSGALGDGDPAQAYEVTLTNNSSATADETGFAVAFYVAAGRTETGSDQETFGTGTFITLGQSLSFAVIEDHTIHGYGDDPNHALTQTGSIPADATSCQFLQWYGGGS